MKFIKKNGMTLVGVMVASSLLAALVLAFNQYVQNQNKALDGATEKMAVIELASILLQKWSELDVCTLNLTDPTYNPGAPFTVPTSPASDFKIDLSRIKEKNAAAPPFLEVGQKASTMESYLSVSTISIVNFSSASSNVYNAELEVRLNGFKHLNLRPTRIRMKVVTDVANKVVSCDSSLNVRLDCQEAVGLMPPACGGNAIGCDTVAACPVGYVLSSCWNEENGGSVMSIVRNSGAPPQDLCLCLSSSTGGECWSSIATCCRMIAL